MYTGNTLLGNLRDSWSFFYQTFLGLGLDKLFQAGARLVSDIPAGDGNIATLFYSVTTATYSVVLFIYWNACNFLSEMFAAKTHFEHFITIEGSPEDSEEYGPLWGIPLKFPKITK